MMSASAASATATALEASEAAVSGALLGEAVDGGETKDMADTRKARAQANLAEMEEATEAYACVPVAAVDAIVGELLTLARHKHQNLGSQIAGQVTGMNEPSEVSAVVDGFVAGITTGLAFDMQALIRILESSDLELMIVGHGLHEQYVQ